MKNIVIILGTMLVYICSVVGVLHLFGMQYDKPLAFFMFSGGLLVAEVFFAMATEKYAQVTRIKQVVFHRFFLHLLFVVIVMLAVTTWLAPVTMPLVGMIGYAVLTSAFYSRLHFEPVKNQA